MKQITIYEFLERNKDILYEGHAYWDKYGGWQYCPSHQYEKPKPEEENGTWYCNDYGYNLNCFNIKDWDGDWQDSLIKVEHKEEDDWLMVDKSTGPEWYKNEKRIK